VRPIAFPFFGAPEVLDGLPKLTIDGVKARFGVLDQSTEILRELTPQTSLVVQGHMVSSNSVETPLLVITTNRDPVSPLEDLELLLTTAPNNEVIVLDLEGHCPPRQMREPVVARWVEDQIKH
jgi:esterase FrsA